MMVIGLGTPWWAGERTFTAPGSAGHKSRSAGDKSESTGDKSGSTSNHSGAVREKHLLWECCRCAWNVTGTPGMRQVHLECFRRTSNAAAAPEMLQVHLECCRCTWDSTGARGIWQVHLDIIANTYCSMIVKTLIFSCILIYVSVYLCIYKATHLHTVYLHWLQTVLESNSTGT